MARTKKSDEAKAVEKQPTGPCPDCNATGLADESHYCPTCNGSGSLNEETPMESETTTEVTEEPTDKPEVEVTEETPETEEVDEPAAE